MLYFFLFFYFFFDNNANQIAHFRIPNPERDMVGPVSIEISLQLASYFSSYSAYSFLNFMSQSQPPFKLVFGCTFFKLHLCLCLI